MKPSLYMISDLPLALEIKLREECPHIHCKIEPDCDLFTATLVWLEVVTRGVALAQAHNACVVSINKDQHPKGKLTSEEVSLLVKVNQDLKERLMGVEVIDGI